MDTLCGIQFFVLDVPDFRDVPHGMQVCREEFEVQAASLPNLSKQIAPVEVKGFTLRAPGSGSSEKRKQQLLIHQESSIANTD